MKTIIAGSRSVTDRRLIAEAVAQSGFVVAEVVSGTARGVDQMGEEWARNVGISVKRFPANWELQGKAAGFIRNLAMRDYADALIAIRDGSSRGTRHMIEAMRAAGKPVFVLQVEA